MSVTSRPVSKRPIESPIELQGELTAAEKALDAAIAALEVLPRAQKRGITPLIEDAFAKVRTARAKLEALLVRNHAALALPPVVTPPEGPRSDADSTNVPAPDGASQGGSHSSKRNSPARRRRRNNRRSNGAK